MVNLPFGTKLGTKTLTTRLALLLFSSLLATSSMAEVIKSPNDSKAYKAITLDNQLRVLLISDPDSDKAAASMNVAVGSSANPEDRAGLAHFLEHMLFLGTEKYPKADEYQNFISSHGGGHNAYTAQENTNYFFDIAANKLEPALDRFAQFFIAPRFDKKYVDRERHAVHSEYMAKIKDDYRRSYAATKQIMNQENGHNRFAVGNLKTLADRDDDYIRDDLLAFYDRYYSANLMSLVVLGKESLPELETMVRTKFSAVKNRNIEAYTTTEPLFIQDQLPQLLQIESVKDIRSLSLTFPLAEVRSHWQEKPLYYISNLLGYEGKGSLLSELKALGWATSLSASQGHDLPNESSFMVNVQLTEAGLANFLKVTQHILQFTKLLQQQGVEQALFDEEKQLSDISFRFQEQAEPIHLVSGLSSQMQRYPTEQIMVADYTFGDFNPALIQRYLTRINAENMLITLKSKQPFDNAANIIKEHYYNVPYAARPLTATEINQLRVTQIDTAYQTKQPNPYVASDLTMLAESSPTVPVLLNKQAGFELWHQQDVSFNIPKANIYFTLLHPEANNSAKNAVLNALYTEMLQEQLNETLYDAYLAGLGTQIYPHMKGISVRLSGYNDKLDLLLTNVTAALRQPAFDSKRFAILKQTMIDNLANAANDKPYNQTMNRLYELLLPQWDRTAQQAAIETVTLDDLKQFAQHFATDAALKVMVHGNLNIEEAQQAGQKIQTALGGTEQNPPAVRVAQIPEGTAQLESLKLNHNDSAISLLLQGENGSAKARAETAVLAEMLAPPFYNEIRTEKQLGYIVFATPLQMNRTPAVAFIVQSPVADGPTLQAEISAFLKRSEQTLANLDETTLARFKASVLSRVTKKDNKLSSRTKRYWRELDWGETTFDTRQQLAEAVEAITVADLQKCFAILQSRQLAVRSTGVKFDSFEKELGTETVSKLFQDLKRQQQFVPAS